MDFFRKTASIGMKTYSYNFRGTEVRALIFPAVLYHAETCLSRTVHTLPIYMTSPRMLPFIHTQNNLRCLQKQVHCLPARGPYQSILPQGFTQIYSTLRVLPVDPSTRRTERYTSLFPTMDSPNKPPQHDIYSKTYSLPTSEPVHIPLPAASYHREHVLGF